MEKQKDSTKQRHVLLVKDYDCEPMHFPAPSRTPTTLFDQYLKGPVRDSVNYPPPPALITTTKSSRNKPLGTSLTTILKDTVYKADPPLLRNIFPRRPVTPHILEKRQPSK